MLDQVFLIHTRTAIQDTSNLSKQTLSTPSGPHLSYMGGVPSIETIFLENPGLETPFRFLRSALEYDTTL
jgi:hypothetical protein